jgi:hypothetical protein
MVGVRDELQAARRERLRVISIQLRKTFTALTEQPLSPRLQAFVDEVREHGTIQRPRRGDVPSASDRQSTW